MSDAISSATGFRDLQLPEPLLNVLNQLGYETPTPIQEQAIPHLLKGKDLLGHAPTGTGKTAAFALPLLSRLKLDSQAVQVLVLAPTRELAIQVAEAFQRYASQLKGFHVLPIYGGQDYSVQLRQLRRGVHVVVGTPGRVMDHMRKGTLKLDGLQALVLDEADEMLRMGFIDDVEWVLEQIPAKRQMALFSATMPPQIQRIARRHLNKPQEISIKAATATAEGIRQRYWLVSGMHKLDALTRILEVEPFDAVLMFVRTRIATVELAQKLEARGYSAAALNGEMAQKQREQMVGRLKKGTLDILVATDVAARGLDVDRISLVVNYDIPYDTEAYIHRIGRTGRAGRTGDAILFVAPRERRMLGAIEHATRQKIERLELPTTEIVNNRRIANFKQSISDTLAAGELEFVRGLLEQYQHEHAVPALDIAAALAKLSLGDQPLLMKPDVQRPASYKRDNFDDRSDRKSRSGKPANRGKKDHDKARGARRVEGKDRAQRSPSRAPSSPGEGMERYRIEVGHQHGVKPGNIVGAITNESGLEGRYIGHIDIQLEYTTVDMPSGIPNDLFQDLKKVRVCGERMDISREGEPPVKHKPPSKRKPNKTPNKKKEKKRAKNMKGKKKKKE